MTTSPESNSNVHTILRFFSHRSVRCIRHRLCYTRAEEPDDRERGIASTPACNSREPPGIDKDRMPYILVFQPSFEVPDEPNWKTCVSHGGDFNIYASLIPAGVRFRYISVLDFECCCRFCLLGILNVAVSSMTSAPSTYSRRDAEEKGRLAGTSSESPEEDVSNSNPMLD